LQSQPLDRDPEILYTSVGRRQQFTSAQNRKEGRSVGPSDADYLPFEHPRSDEFYPFPLPSLFPLLRVIGLDNALGTITHSSLEIDTEMRASALSPSLLPSNLHYYSFLARIARIAYAESDAEFCNIMNFNEVYKPMRGTYFSGVAGAAGNFSRKQLFARHALYRIVIYRFYSGIIRPLSCLFYANFAGKALFPRPRARAGIIYPTRHGHIYTRAACIFTPTELVAE